MSDAQTIPMETECNQVSLAVIAGHAVHPAQLHNLLNIATLKYSPR